MEQGLSKIESVYDAVAEEWAKAFSGEHEKKPQDKEMLFRFSREIEGKTPVWDFGCGPGNTTLYLRNQGIEISGLDISEKMLLQAREAHPGIHFQKGNILDLDFENNSIFGIVAFYAIVHFTEEQVETAFREIFRVLKSGGRFLFTFHVGEGTIHLDTYLGKQVDIDFSFFKTDFISGCLQRAGFEQIEIIEREPYPGVEFSSRRAYVFATRPATNKS